ncbi:MAG: nucleotidyltransferase substrate binding protein [Deltaproteobacteria bacterium]|nr:nucleotidyltransferase substrate binding protein [Deltaproteobacteria bacterium]
MKELDFTGYENALKTLKTAIKKSRLNELERDGAIQRFEYTFELAWKMIRKALLAMGRAEVSSSPRPIFRDALEEGLIEDIKNWFAFLEARNLSTHIYNEDEAENVYNSAKEFLPYAEELLKKLKELKKNEAHEK